MPSKTVEFRLEKSTKNTYKFEELAPKDSQVVRNIYVTKAAFSAEPKLLRVTLECAEIAGPAGGVSAR